MEMVGLVIFLLVMLFPLICGVRLIKVGKEMNSKAKSIGGWIIAGVYIFAGVWIFAAVLQYIFS